ncbi:MAG: hypothetical protein ACYC8V_08040 [Caulobacteraceae bacterium]
MARFPILLLAVSWGLAGCYSTHTENAALQMPLPHAQAPELLAYVAPDPDYPSIGGDILKGASPLEQAQARAAADRTVVRRR